VPALTSGLWRSNRAASFAAAAAAAAPQPPPEEDTPASQHERSGERSEARAERKPKA